MFFHRDNQSIIEEIKYICSLMVDVLKMPIYFLDNNNDIIFSFSYGYFTNPLHPDIKQLFGQLFNLRNSYKFPIVKSTKYLENYFAVSLNKEDIFIGTIIVGPSIYSYITAETIDALISENKLPLSYKRDLISYYNSITIMDYKRLINSSLLLYYSIYNKKLTLSEVIEKNSSPEKVSSKIKSSFQNSVSTNRQNMFFHHSQAYEKNLFYCIKTGNKEKLMEYLQNPADGEFGILSKNNPLRSQKNLSICMVALATRAAMEGGLNSESAYTLSDLYIQAIEETYDIKDLSDLNTKMLCDFTDKVQEIRQHKYSRAINICQNFIFKHLYEEINLSKLAKTVQLNPNYLSQLFKKEVGIPINEYIKRQRIEEAKKLLVSSNYSLLDIAAWLNFHDQSHFTRLFRKFTGTTPKKYRDKYREI